MAIYAPTIDYSATANAISTKRNTIQAGIATESQKLKQNSLTIAGKQLDLNDANIKLQKWQLATDTVFKAAEIGIGIWDAAKAKTEQAQFDTAKNSAIDQGLQFSELVTESILNGRTKVVQDADGQWDVQMDKGLTDWHSAQLKAINDSSDSKAVKAWRTQTLNQTYSSGQSQILSGVLKQTQATIGQQYDLGISKAAEVDIANGNYEMGTSLINSHSGFSPMQREVQLGAYQKFVDTNVEKRNVSTLAATEGLGVATEYAYSLGTKGYSEDEIQKFVATASVTDKQLTTGLVESATSFMQSGLEAGKGPKELYDQLESKLESVPKERAQTAKDAAKDAHIAWATSKGYEMWNEDSESVDIAHLQSQRDSIIKKDGEAYLTIFAGLDKTQETFASFYDKRIAAIEKEVTTYGKSLTTAQIKENKQFMDATFENMKAGTISPATAMQAVSGLSGNTPGEYDDDLYEMKLLDKIKDNIVPDAYKPSVTKFMSEMEGLKFGVTTNKTLTDEETGKIAQARMFANEAIATLFMATAANDMSVDKFTSALAGIKQTFVGKSISALESGTVEDKWRLFNDPTALDDALAKNQQFGSLEASPVILAQSGQIQWAKPEMKATYDAIATEIGQQLKTQFGITATSAPSPLMIEGKPYPVPIIQGETQAGGRQWFAVDKDDIFTSKDGKTWEHWASFETTKKFNNNSQVNSFFNQFRQEPTQTKKEKRVQDYQDKKAGTISPATAMNDPAALDDALAKNQQFGSLKASPVILAQSGQMHWAKPEMKATYDAIGDELAQQFKSQMGIDLTSERSLLKINGKVYPTPIFQGKAPEWENSCYFAVDQGDIFASSDGKTWQYWNSFDTVAKFKKTTPVNEFFNQFRQEPTQTKKEKRVQDYQQKKAEKDPEGKHKQL